MPEYRIEVCANSLQSAINAQAAGAYRVELCADMAQGGTTPSLGTIAMTRRALDRAKLNVMIRARGGDFLCSSDEVEIMLHDIHAARRLHVDGIVFGCLTADGDIDTDVLKELVATAGDTSITFHRAFDRCRNPHDALDCLMHFGIDRVLTSGQQQSAEDGIPLLKSLVEQAAGRIIIMPGCGVNAANIRRIASETGASEFHLSARAHVESRMRFRHPSFTADEVLTLNEFRIDESSSSKVSAAISALLS